MACVKPPHWQRAWACWCRPQTCRPHPTLLTHTQRCHLAGTAYQANYTFYVEPAWISPQPITYRYFICLYQDAFGLVSQRSGASVDVVRGWSCLCLLPSGFSLPGSGLAWELRHEPGLA